MPVHVNQLRAGGRFPNGKPSGGYDCTVAVGMMALDDFTGGAIRPSATEFRRRQGDQSGGIGLDDVAQTWKSYGLTFSHGPKSWGAIMTRLRAGKPVALQGQSGALGPFAIGRSVPHAIYATRAAPNDTIVIHDPLASGARAIPETYVRRFYLTGLALAGWGAGTYTGGSASPGGTLASAPFIDIPEGKILTKDDVDGVILAAFDRAGMFADDPLGMARAKVRLRLLLVIGQPWNQKTRDALQSSIGQAAIDANPLGDVAAGLGDAIGEGAFVLVVGGTIAALFLLGAWRLTK